MMFRSVFIFGFSLIVTSLIGSFWLFNLWGQGRGGAGKINEITEEKYKVFEYTVGQGDTWEAITKKLAIDRNLGASLLEAAKDVHNLAVLREGNEFRFVYDPATNELVGVEYDIDEEKILTVEKSEIPRPEGSGSRSQSDLGANSNDQNSNIQTVTGGVEMFEARLENIEYEITPVLKGGVIESSLFETAQKKDIPAGIIMEMARIFSWDVDFASSVQPQDTFVILYEERYRINNIAKSDLPALTETSGGRTSKNPIPGKILAAKFVNDGRTVYAFYFEPPQEYLPTPEVGKYYNEEGRELRRQFLRSPLDYRRITSGFSYNRFHPILQSFTTHRAIDYSASMGTPISSTADGTVTFAGWRGGNGKYVGIQHENGYSTGYAHLSAYAKGIAAGATVEQNQVIGFVGSTGWSTGPHLHYEMRKNGALINPLRLDLPLGKMLKEDYREEFNKRRDELLHILQEK